MWVKVQINVAVIEMLLQCLYLRKFKKLRTLNLSGNPFCSTDEYKQYIVAFLPHLEYLDYRLIDEDTVSVMSGHTPVLIPRV